MKNSSRVSANRNALLELRDRVEGKNISVGFQWLSRPRVKASVSKAESVYRFESKPEDRIRRRQRIMGFYEARERDNSPATRRRSAGKCIFDRVFDHCVWIFHASP